MKVPFRLLAVSLAARAFAGDTSDLIWNKSNEGDVTIYRAMAPTEAPKGKPPKGKPAKPSASIVGEVRINCGTKKAIIIANEAVQMEINDTVVVVSATKTLLPDEESQVITSALACDAKTPPDDAKVEAAFPIVRTKYFPPAVLVKGN